MGFLCNSAYHSSDFEKSKFNVLNSVRHVEGPLGVRLKKPAGKLAEKCLINEENQIDICGVLELTRQATKNAS